MIFGKISLYFFVNGAYNVQWDGALTELGTYRGIVTPADSTHVGSAINAGEYTATVKLSDPDHSTWADGSTGDKSVPWSISKAEPTLGTITAVFYSNSDKYVYSSAELAGTLTPPEENPTLEGDYAFVFTPNDSNYAVDTVYIHVTISDVIVTETY